MTRLSMTNHESQVAGKWINHLLILKMDSGGKPLCQKVVSSSTRPWHRFSTSTSQEFPWRHYHFFEIVFQLAFFYSKGHLPSIATQDMYNRPIVFRICSGHTLWVTCLLLTFCHLHPLPHDKSQEWSCVSVSSIYHNLQGNTAKTQKVSNSEASGSHWNWPEKLGTSFLGHLHAARLGRHFQINWAVWKRQRPAKEPERERELWNFLENSQINWTAYKRQKQSKHLEETESAQTSWKIWRLAELPGRQFSHLLNCLQVVQWVPGSQLWWPVTHACLGFWRSAVFVSFLLQ